MSQKNKTDLIVYSCSGCSSAAQMANHIAICLDRAQLAEMSCIAGVGGGVRPLVQKAKSGRPILTIDGCALKCCQACLAQQQVEATMSYVLSDYQVAKQQHQDFEPAHAQKIFEEIQTQILADLS